MANFNLNKVIIGGRLVAEPEVKKTPNDTSILRFTLAVNRRYQPKDNDNGAPTADFISCTAWRQTAEFIAGYFHKGSSLAIVGHIETRTFEDKDRVKHYMTDVIVEEAYFVDSKAEKEKAAAAQPTGYMPSAYTAPPPAGAPVQAPPPTLTQTPSFNPANFEILASNEELPF
jgi:single-strand DNA-binding protein